MTDAIVVEIRAGILNQAAEAADYDVTLIAVKSTGEEILHREHLRIEGQAGGVVTYRWATQGQAGSHTVVAEVRARGEVQRLEQPLQVLPLGRRSTRRIDGAFCGLLHWSEQEGRLWNEDMRRMTDADWREMLRAQHDIGINIVVIQETFRNEQYVDKHSIERDGYQGKAYYPSELYPGRMPIPSADPIEVLLDEADKLGMQVFVPLGLYAWFDFTPASLDWHKRVADELWRFYGQHPSFYGWYVSEEIHGHLGSTNRHREDLIEFFAQLKAHCNKLSPGKPLMLAPNCHGIRDLDAYYHRLLKHLDIICPFGFHRMPMFDLNGRQAAELLQQWCNEAGAHLWLDLEAFLFKPDQALYPRPIEELVADLDRYDNFEKIIAYQYPGLLSAPWARLQPGGEASIRLYQDYQHYYESLDGVLAPTS